MPYRSLSALMIPRHHRLPRGSVWRAATLPAIPRRSRGSSPLPRSPGGAFSLHGPRRARPRTPDRRGGPCLGTRAETLRDCAPGTAASRASTRWRDTGSASHRKPCLPPSVSSYLRADMHLRQEFLRKAPAILELLVGSQPDLTLRAPQSRVLDRASHRHRSPTLTRPFGSPDDVGCLRDLSSSHERLSYQVRHRASRRPALACPPASHAQLDPPTTLAPASPSASVLHSFSSSYLLSPLLSF